MPPMATKSTRAVHQFAEQAGGIELSAGGC